MAGLFGFPDARPKACSVLDYYESVTEHYHLHTGSSG